ncbi:MAG: hypothetical protein NXI22_01185 [bacterium]|nr:hypothetical protein [bacterium]
MQQHFEIAGTGAHLPAKAVTAADADQLGGLEPGWTSSRTRVQTRYYCRPPETLQSMAVAAIEQAMNLADVTWKDIDLIIDGSTSRYRPIPANAIHVQSAFGSAAAGTPCLDVHSSCLGFILAVNVANALFAQQLYRQVLIVVSEQSSICANWRQPESAAIIGDGAAAAVLKIAQKQQPASFAHETYAEHISQCLIDGGGHLMTADQYSSETDERFRFSMDGPAIMRVAARYLPSMFDKLLADAGACRKATTVVPHQASPKALKIMRRLLGMEADRFLTGVESFGNVAAAGIPIALHRAIESGTVKRGNRLALLGTSAGYSQAGLVFEY